MIDLGKPTIIKLQAEQPRAVLMFYRQVYPALHVFFKHKVAVLEDREELVQDTIVSIFDSLPQFNYDSKFSTWVYSIAKHELVDYYRRKKIKTIVFSKLPFLKQIVDKALGPQFALEEKEAKHKLFQTFRNLSEGYAHILRLRYMEGLSVVTIAKRLNISYKAAESKLSRARRAFQLEFVRDRSLVPALSQVHRSS